MDGTKGGHREGTKRGYKERVQREGTKRGYKRRIQREDTKQDTKGGYKGRVPREGTRTIQREATGAYQEYKGKTKAVCRNMGNEV